MTIITNCINHGELTIDQVIKSGINRRHQRYRCKLCAKKIRRNNYLLNRETISKRNLANKRAKKEYYREMNRKYIEKIKQKININKDEEMSGAYLYAKKRLIKVLMDISELERYVNK